MSLAPDRLAIEISRHFTSPGTHPYDQVHIYFLAHLIKWSWNSLSFISTSSISFWKLPDLSCSMYIFTLTTISISVPLLSKHLNSQLHGGSMDGIKVPTRAVTESIAALLSCNRALISHSPHLDSQHCFRYHPNPGSA